MNVVVLMGLHFRGRGRRPVMEVIFWEELLKASPGPGKTNCRLALRRGMPLSQLEKLVTPLCQRI